MDTIDSMQSGDIQKLCNPIAPIIMPESRATDNASGRLALNTDRSQFYTNENGQLCLMTPVDIVDTSMLTPGTPITINFRNMSITHGDKTFRFPAAPNITGTGPITVENNEIGLNLSDSFFLEGSMDGTENATSSLELKYPIAITGDLPSDPRAPLTFNFQSGEISRGDATFPLSNSNVTPDLIAKSITTNDVNIQSQDVNIQSQNVTLYKISNMLYLVGFVTLTSTIQIPPETRIYNISFPSITVTKPLHGAISPHAYSSTIPYVRFNTSNSSFIVMNMTQIQKAFTFTINFSHIIGYI